MPALIICGCRQGYEVSLCCCARLPDVGLDCIYDVRLTARDENTGIVTIGERKKKEKEEKERKSERVSVTMCFS